MLIIIIIIILLYGCSNETVCCQRSDDLSSWPEHCDEDDCSGVNCSTAPVRFRVTCEALKFKLQAPVDAAPDGPMSQVGSILRLRMIIQMFIVNVLRLWIPRLVYSELIGGYEGYLNRMKVALGNRGMTVDAARREWSKEWRALVHK